MRNNEIHPNKLLNTTQAAEILGLGKRALEKWRRSSIPKGPRFVDIEGTIRYRMSDLNKYIESNVKTSGDEYK
jgi:phage terminase Nu1 subunit (DNA packaging protein)